MKESTESPVVFFRKLESAGNLPLPSYESEHAAGMDLRAALEESIELASGERMLVPTGLQMALPIGYEAQIRPRSGLAYKHGITLLNTPGTIDADYRGELKVLMINLGDSSFPINHGDRIAQMIVAPVAQATVQQVDTLPDTERGSGGFGSTGK